MVIVGSGDGPVRTASGAADQRGVRLPLPWAEHVAPIGASAFGGRVGGALALGWHGGHQVAKWYFGCNLLT